MGQEDEGLHQQNLAFGWVCVVWALPQHAEVDALFNEYDDDGGGP